MEVDCDTKIYHWNYFIKKILWLWILEVSGDFISSLHIHSFEDFHWFVPIVVSRKHMIHYIMA